MKRNKFYAWLLIIFVFGPIVALGVGNIMMLPNESNFWAITASVVAIGDFLIVPLTIKYLLTAK